MSKTPLSSLNFSNFLLKYRYILSKTPLSSRCHNSINEKPGGAGVTTRKIILKSRLFFFFFKFLDHILRPDKFFFISSEMRPIFDRTRARYAWLALKTWLSLIHKRLGFSNFNPESWKWPPVATFKSFANKSALSFFDFQLFHLQKQVLSHFSRRKGSPY